MGSQKYLFFVNFFFVQNYTKKNQCNKKENRTEVIEKPGLEGIGGIKCPYGP